jgi:hypothetical protein
MPDTPLPPPSCLVTVLGWLAILVYAVVTAVLVLLAVYEVWQVWLWF